jgi:hypothetical protein
VRRARSQRLAFLARRPYPPPLPTHPHPPHPPCPHLPQARGGGGCLVEIEERGWEEGGVGGELAFNRYDEP